MASMSINLTLDKKMVATIIAGINEDFSNRIDRQAQEINGLEQALDIAEEATLRAEALIQ